MRHACCCLDNSDGVVEDMSLASSILRDTFSSPSPWPWPRGLCPWPCDYKAVKFSMTHIDRSTDTSAIKVLMIRANIVIQTYCALQATASTAFAASCVITALTVGTIP